STPPTVSSMLRTSFSVPPHLACAFEPPAPLLFSERPSASVALPQSAGALRHSFSAASPRRSYDYPRWQNHPCSAEHGPQVPAATLAPSHPPETADTATQPTQFPRFPY